jgi:hypothetical protein
MLLAVIVGWFLILVIVACNCKQPKWYKEVVNLTNGKATMRIERGIRYLNLTDLLMIDWDPVPAGEQELDKNHYTISSIEEVDNILKRRVHSHPDELWEAYLTPSGGVHAFLVSHSTPCGEGIDIIKEMQGDLLYAKMCSLRNYYGVRVSPKIVNGLPREGDYVAKYWKSYGGGIALPDNSSIMKLHDSFLL